MFLGRRLDTINKKKGMNIQCSFLKVEVTGSELLTYIVLRNIIEPSPEAAFKAN